LNVVDTSNAREFSAIVKDVTDAAFLPTKSVYGTGTDGKARTWREDRDR
jgi:hypothetical protein